MQGENARPADSSGKINGMVFTKSIDILYRILIQPVDHPHVQTDGGETGGSLHQDPADAERDDGRRPGIRGEGKVSMSIVSLFFKIPHIDHSFFKN